MPAFAVGIDIPRLTGPVIDQAGLFNPRQKDELENFLYALDQKTSVQLAVLTVQSLLGESIEQASIRVVDQWQLGQKKTDKGLLILVAKDERRVRIEVGQGLEGDIPDAYSKRIIDKHIVPNFKQGLFYKGVMQGVLQLCNLALSPKEKKIILAKTDQFKVLNKNKHQQSAPWPFMLFFIFMIALKIYMARAQYRQQGSAYMRRGRHFNRFDDFFGGGGFGSGSGGFSGGGGGFSGGGSSGSW
ncbi:TPM domain-containing protein [bacterium]|nr:TPM domain-containing protein [bacterium]